MAILFQLIESADLGRLSGGRAQVLQLPPVKAKRYSAAGVTDAFSAGALVFELTNLGDAIYARVGLVTDATQAADGNSLTVRVETGGILPFMLPDDTNPALWRLDVRAVA